MKCPPLIQSVVAKVGLELTHVKCGYIVLSLQQGLCKAVAPQGLCVGVYVAGTMTAVSPAWWGRSQCPCTQTRRGERTHQTAMGQHR